MYDRVIFFELIVKQKIKEKDKKEENHWKHNIKPKTKARSGKFFFFVRKIG